jgi:MinD-like ATPase involved in chromosome partitioning or flagellar assembly
MPRPEDLLLPDRPSVTDAPATWGWRGRVNRMSAGVIKPKAKSAELQHRQAVLDIQHGFSRPMTVVVIQPKGGAGKTPTAIGLASTLGAHRGGYVVGWDDNETRGTLAVRTINRDSQRTTVWDFLGALPSFERLDARVGDLSYYVRSQGDAYFDALVSDDHPANMAQIGEQEFRRIHSVLQRFYRIIVIDTGNNVRSPNWQAAVNAADVVVIPSTYQRDVGFSASWVLDHLLQTGREDLAQHAVTVLTAADPTTDAKVRQELQRHFWTRTQHVVEIPFDEHIATGGPIHWSTLADETRHAYTRLGAVVVKALTRRDQPVR